jgi:hypothetical protein
MQKTFNNKEREFFMVNRSIKESDLIINDGKAHCPQQTSYNKITPVTAVTKEANLQNSKINQANRIINRTSSTMKSTKHKILKVFHQNIRGLKNKTNGPGGSLNSTITHILCLTKHHMKRLELRHTHIKITN